MNLKTGTFLLFVWSFCQCAAGQDPLNSTGDLLEVDVSDYDRAHAIHLLRKHDRDRDRVLNESEMKSLKLRMPTAVIDVNRNRRITTLELAIYFANASQQLTITSVENYAAQQLINQHDRNADGSLSEQEQSQFPLNSEADAIDVNKDEAIDAFELAAWFTETYEKTGIDARDFRTAANYLNKLDQDDSLSLNQEESSPGIWPIDPWQLDKDRNKELQTTEIAGVFAKFKHDAGIENGHEQGATRAMNRYDKDRNGRLDIGEIERGNWPKDWETFDYDEDGFLTSFELSARFAEKQRALGVDRNTLEQAQALIRRYDRNRNGFVDLQEMLESRADVGAIDTDTFLDLDTDGNQKLSKVELAVKFAAEGKK